MKLPSLLLMMMVLVSFAGAAPVRGQAVSTVPNIGYVFPAGGQQGKTVRVVLGGQRLRGATEVIISGEGVSGAVIKHYRPLRNISSEERQALREAWSTAARARWDELVATGAVRKSAPFGRAKQVSPGAAASQPAAKLPEHPLLEDLDAKSLPELLHVREVLLENRKAQPNAQIGESLVLEIAIDPAASPGDRELRILSRAGLSNPLVFQVGSLPEARELEDNDPEATSPLPPAAALKLPVLMNGQIMPGDIDRFAITARRGQVLRVRADARRLVPFLADAVPGWFQATLALYGEDGREIAFADDNESDPDPVLTLRVPKTGDYQLEIRDSIYRGREDFVYRLSVDVGDEPPVTALHWAGVEQPGESIASGPPTILTMPARLSGVIGEAGEMDAYRFRGRAGDPVVAEVTARRTGSPLDALLRVLDTDGRVIAWNDDYVQVDDHLHLAVTNLTHHADPTILTTLPHDGEYILQVLDAQGRGGSDFHYALRLEAPRPDYELAVTPSSVNIAAGRSAVIDVHVLRKDGYSGPVSLRLRDAPQGVVLAGGEVPAGVDHVRATLSAAAGNGTAPAPLRIEGIATIDGQTVEHEARPADDVMQAFLYRHLVPRENCLVAVGRATAGARWARPETRSLGITAAAAGQLAFTIPKNVKPDTVEVVVIAAPSGLTLGEPRVKGDTVHCSVHVASGADGSGLAGNLIVEVFAESPASAGGRPAKAPARQSLGILPAVSVNIASAPESEP